MESPNFVAGGNIYPSRICVLDSSSDSTTGPAGSFVALAAISTDAAAVYNGRAVVGISMPGTDYPPINDSHVSVGGYAAIAGEDLQILGPGQYAMLELSTTLAAGQRVIAAGTGSSDTAAGKGAPIGAYSSGTPQQYVGYALQSGVAGDKVLVFVQPGIF